MRKAVHGTNIATDQIKAKIQGLRTTFREELRKVKKSYSTGSGAADIYIPKWKFYDACKFLEKVVILDSSQSVSNIPSIDSNSNRQVDDNEDDDAQSVVSDTTQSDISQNDAEKNELEMGTPKSVQTHSKSKRRKVSSPNPTWMDTASEALQSLAQSAREPSGDEWDDFGKDVANSIRGLSSTKSFVRNC